MKAVKLDDKVYELTEEEAHKVEAKIRRIIANRLTDEDVADEVGAILYALQDAEPNKDNNRYHYIYQNTHSGNIYLSYAYILEEIRKIVPTMSSKRLTKILTQMGIEAKWDTNRRIYTDRSYRWIKL